MRPIPIDSRGPREVQANPAGRVDILFRGLFEVAAKKFECAVKMPGIADALRPVVEEKVSEYEGMNLLEFARKVGFLKSKRKRRRIA